MSKITPFIRCIADGKSQAEHYCTIFPGAKITNTNPIVTTFEIFGQTLATLNGGEHPGATLNPSISFSLWIKDKEETKRIRDLLADGGSVLMPFEEYVWSPAYGWCNDKYGVSRQVMYDNRPEGTNALVPSLMFIGANDGKAKEAMSRYISIFPDSSQGQIHAYGEMGGPDKPDHVAHAEFTLANQLFIAMDSGMDHQFNFTDGISLSVACADQAEVDKYRDALIADGGQESQCGRCKDKYGVSRQIVPLPLPDALFQADQEKANYAMQAMMKMKKIIVADLYPH